MRDKECVRDGQRVRESDNNYKSSEREGGRVRESTRRRTLREGENERDSE